MNQETIAVALCCAALSLAAGEACAGLHKCRQDNRTLYQEAPCPPGSASLPVDGAAAAPDAESVGAARTRAKAEVAAAEEIRKREAREEAERQARQAEADKQARACARLLAVIRDEEADARPDDRKKGGRKARSDRRKYLLECGPL